MTYLWILFDADGTLLDYDKAESTALQQAFAQIGQPYERSYIEVYRQINTRIWRDLEQGRISQERLRTRRFELLSDALQIALDPQAFSKVYLKHLAMRSDLIDGAQQTVSSLYGQVRMAIVTNGLADVQRPRLHASTIYPFLEGIVISEEVGAAKPDAAFFDAAFCRMGGPRRADVLIVGDSLSSDMAGGAAYGIDTCWFNPGQLPEDPAFHIQYQISRLQELLRIVGVE
jgi:2-haloacid dehalogenase